MAVKLQEVNGFEHRSSLRQAHCFSLMVLRLRLGQAVVVGDAAPLVGRHMPSHSATSSIS